MTTAYTTARNQLNVELELDGSVWTGLFDSRDIDRYAGSNETLLVEEFGQAKVDELFPDGVRADCHAASHAASHAAIAARLSAIRTALRAASTKSRAVRSSSCIILILCAWDVCVECVRCVERVQRGVHVVVGRPRRYSGAVARVSAGGAARRGAARVGA